MIFGRSLVHLTAYAIALAAFVFAVLGEDTELRVGLFALAGTLVGALTTYEAAQGSARREQNARRRTAGRLLQEDLLHAQARCQYALVNERFWAPRLDLFLEGWERYREIVSQELADSDWRAVARAFASMRAVQSKCDGRRESSGEDRPAVGDHSRGLIDGYLDNSPHAIDALRRLSGDRPADEEIDKAGE